MALLTAGRRRNGARHLGGGSGQGRCRCLSYGGGSWRRAGCGGRNANFPNNAGRYQSRAHTLLYRSEHVTGTRNEERDHMKSRTRTQPLTSLVPNLTPEFARSGGSRIRSVPDSPARLSGHRWDREESGIKRRATQQDSFRSIPRPGPGANCTSCSEKQIIWSLTGASRETAPGGKTRWDVGQ